MTQSTEAKLLSVLVASVLALASYAIVASTVPTTDATTGMGNCKEEDDCTRQPDRVGADNDDPDNEGEDAERDGPGGSDESPETEEDEGEANCWGKVSSALGKQQNEIEGPAHASNPTPDEDNDTPREGVGNQREGHPSDHADTVGNFAGIDEDCVD